MHKRGIKGRMFRRRAKGQMDNRSNINKRSNVVTELLIYKRKSRRAKRRMDKMLVYKIPAAR